MFKEPVFLTDKNRVVVLEALSGPANAAIPDSLEPFEVLVPNTSDGASEKHLPVIETEGLHVTVRVGSNSHPMTQEHSITFVCLLTRAGQVMRVYLDSGCEPKAHFTVEEGDAPAAAYAYCNLHGFWKTVA